MGQVMGGKKVIAICQSGGEFETDKDGSLSYRGGDAHAMEIEEHMKYKNFKVEVAEMFNCNLGNISIKYFLPGNKKTLITISNEKDLKRMIKFHGNSDTADIYVLTEEVAAADVSNMPASRSSHTTLSESGVLVDAPLSVVEDDVDNTTQPADLLDASFVILDDTAHVDDCIDLPTEMPLPLCVGFNDEKHIRAAQQWQNTITGVGQRFNSVHEFREALRKYAIAHQFAFKYKKNDSHRVTVKCKADGCPWRIHASRLSTTQLICIKKMNATHTCEGAAVTTGHQATRSWVASIIKEKLKLRCITFVADRGKGIKESITDIFCDVDVQHGYCIRYLSEQLITDLTGQFSHEVKRLMVEDFYAAAFAPRPEGFQRCVESIKNISLEAYNWVMQSEPVHWANAFFQGARYNHLTANFGELFYSWASDAHELPITQMVDAIRGKIMELIHTRHTDSNQWLTRLTPSMEEKLEKESLKVRSLQVLILAGNRFEVRGESIEVVDIDHWDCSCKGWQLTGLPCCHAIAVISCLGRNPYDYCSRYFTADGYRLTYSESIHPVPNAERPMQKDSSQSAVTVTPPPTRRPPGRPTTKRFGSQDVIKRQLQCSRCKDPWLAQKYVVVCRN
ncbi:hypothetical protein HYC85_001982 [Camellia sinensis]|uniref:SWIM-type domain-containing protein n=1 Tax=Camellia sinensis TaxID=4442 RepID=A0A7J7I6W6_CAMSI|nr:hypothetical protein HYC85_001982 [Camellia sinensis]